MLQSQDRQIKEARRGCAILIAQATIYTLAAALIVTAIYLAILQR